MRPGIGAVPSNNCDFGVITPHSPLRVLTPHFAFPTPHPSRRDFLHWVSCGLGGAALLHLLGRDRPASAGGVSGEADDPPPHFPARAKRAIHIFLCGGLSQVDSFDYKPALETYHGKSLSADERPDVFFGQVGLLRKPDWEFKQRGQSGLWVSELFPHLANAADELTEIGRASCRKECQ